MDLDNTMFFKADNGKKTEIQEIIWHWPKRGMTRSIRLWDIFFPATLPILQVTTMPAH